MLQLAEKLAIIANKIFDAFKTGQKNVAELWITMNNHLIHIRYFAVRNKNGKYFGDYESNARLDGY